MTPKVLVFYVFTDLHFTDNHMFIVDILCPFHDYLSAIPVSIYLRIKIIEQNLAQLLMIIAVK